MHPSSPQWMYTLSKASSATLQPGSTSWLMFNYRGWLESSRTNILRLRLNMQRSVSWAQAHDCISLGVNFTHENIRTGCILWGRGLDLHLSGCNPHPTPFQSTRVSTNSENGNDPLLHRFRINEGLCYHNKVKRKWRNYQSIWGPKLEKEILFYQSLKWLLTCIFREQMSKGGFVCVCVCVCVCVLTIIHGLVLYPEFGICFKLILFLPRTEGGL